MPRSQKNQLLTFWRLSKERACGRGPSSGQCLVSHSGRLFISRWIGLCSSHHVLASRCRSNRQPETVKACLKGAVFVGEVGSFQLSLLSRIWELISYEQQMCPPLSCLKLNGLMWKLRLGPSSFFFFLQHHFWGGSTGLSNTQEAIGKRHRRLNSN